MLKSMRKHGMTLAAFAALTTGLTAVVNHLTADTINLQAQKQQKVLFDQVLPTSLYNNDLQNECYLVSDVALGNKLQHKLYLARLNEKPVAAAIESTAPDGYSGAIQLLVAADFNGTIYGTRVIEHHETPGLGDKIDLRISDWITSLTGFKLQGHDDKRLAVKKDGGEFDQFTGATITPRAVVNAAKRTTLFLETVPAMLETLPRCGGNNE